MTSLARLGEPRRRQRRDDRPRPRRAARCAPGSARATTSRTTRRAPSTTRACAARPAARSSPSSTPWPWSAASSVRPPCSTTSSAARAGSTNADDVFLGPLLPRVALANSRNVPAVDLLGRVGLDEGYGLFRSLGLHRRRAAGPALRPGPRDRRPAGHPGRAGAPPTWPWRATAASPAPAGTAGQELPPPRRIFSEETARLVTLFLSDPQARLPTFPRMGTAEYRFPVAVKTGTSTRLPRRLGRGLVEPLPGRASGSAIRTSAR